MAEVINIYICLDKGLPMISVNSTTAIAGLGLSEDRYSTGKGAYSKSKIKKIRHVSLISIEAIEEANRELATPFLPEETRRNILTQGIDLNSLVGKEFTVGVVKMRGTELCDPCKRPSILAGKSDFDSAFENKGGLRAEILSDGEIKVGDEILI